MTITWSLTGGDPGTARDGGEDADVPLATADGGEPFRAMGVEGVEATADAVDPSDAVREETTPVAKVLTCSGGGVLGRGRDTPGAGGPVGAAGEVASARDGLVKLAATWDARDPLGAASLIDGSRRPMGCTERPSSAKKYKWRMATGPPA